jgi:biopolymer transport protein ExbD
MSIRFRCPSCQEILKVAANQAGRSIGCPKCSQVLRVPDPNGRPANKAAMGGAAAEGNGPDEGGIRTQMPFQSIAGTADDEMDMTPMVDVTFLLLVFFMITAAFAMQKSIEVPPTDDQEAAQAQSVDEFEDDSIIIRVDSDNTYWIQSPDWSEEKEALSKQDMLMQLREARTPASGSGPGPTKLLVLASGDAVHERVVAALDAGSAVGMEEIQLATVEDEF